MALKNGSHLLAEGVPYRAPAGVLAQKRLARSKITNKKGWLVLTRLAGGRGCPHPCSYEDHVGAAGTRLDIQRV